MVIQVSCDKNKRTKIQRWKKVGTHLLKSRSIFPMAVAITLWVPSCLGWFVRLEVSGHIAAVL